MRNNSALQIRVAKDPRNLYRLLRRLQLTLLRTAAPLLSQKSYMSQLTRIFRHYGMNIIGEPIYISSQCWIDGTDYSLITIEDKVVISSHVSLLTHDFSISRARDAITQQRCLPEIALIREIHIGENSFIGRSAILMPGTHLGKNCIVGAGSVVRGRVPDNSLLIGNPAQIIGDTINWGTEKLIELGIDISDGYKNDRK